MHNESCGLLTREGVSIPLKGVEVRGGIIGRSARVRISQYFKNEEEKPLEAVYKFPLPEGSSVCGFKAEVGEKVIRGKVEERDKAFEIYDDALSRGDGGYLLDEERPNIFTLSVGNLNPGNSVTIQLDYVTLLDSHNSEIRFFLPTTISPRYIPSGMKDDNGIPVDEMVNPPIALENAYSMKIILDILGRENIQLLESPSHTISTTFNDNSVRVELSSETTVMDRDFILNIKYRDDFETTSYLCSADNEIFIQLDFTPKLPAESGRNNISDQELIFVLDCSGSMQGSSIDEAKRALTILLKALEPGIRFNIYRFGSTYTRFFEKGMIYDQKSLEIALKYVSGIKADLGGTEILAPLKAIQKNITGDHIIDVILLTDGEVGNEQQVINLVGSKKSRMRMFTIGIGNGPNEYFIKQLARSTSGASEMVSPNERIETKVLRLFGKVSTSNVIQNLRVKWNADALSSEIPSHIYGGETVSLFAKLRDDVRSPKEITVSGTINKKKQEWVVSIKKVNIHNDPVPLLWARERIRALEESAGYSPGSRQIQRKQSKTRQDIIDISKKYGIISRETSFIGEETRLESERSTEELVLRKVPVMLTTGWGGFQSTGLVFAAAEPVLNEMMMFRSESVIPHRHRTGYIDLPEEPEITRTVSKEESELFDILALQRVDGGFDIDAVLARTLKTTLSELYRISEKINSKGNPDKFIILSTALVLTYLESYYRDQKSSWYPVVQKSLKWLENQIIGFNPDIEGIELESWVKEFLKEKGIIII